MLAVHRTRNDGKIRRKVTEVGEEKHCLEEGTDNPHDGNKGKTEEAEGTSKGGIEELRRGRCNG